MTDVTLTMDRPATTSLLDTGAQALIGKPVDRIDGPMKVAGAATYAAEYPAENLAYGFLVETKFGRGKVTEIDVAAARAVPGVIEVVTDLPGFIRNPQQGGERGAPTQGVADVRYFGEIVAIVVAERFEVARDAAERVVVSYEQESGRFDFDALIDEAELPKGPNSTPPHSKQGDLDRAMAEATITVDSTYTTPSQNSAAMEPHASTALWDEDGNLTLFGAFQMPSSERSQLAKALGIKEKQVRIVARYVGGGFGSKLGISQESVAAAIAARQIGRPVKAVMTRQQVFNATVRRSNTRQRVCLAAEPDGRLTGIGHETITSNLPGEEFYEPAGIATHFLYAAEHRRITHDIVRLDWLLSGSMRAPGEAVGLLALECAMDELAEKVGIDPIELRRRNEPECGPENAVPFSTRQLVRCMDEGAARFGWDRRGQPAAERDGDWLIGMGMAAAARSNMLQPSSASVRLDADGRATIATDMTDIGTGTYTILAQIAGELLGLPVERIEVRLGDTDSPPGAGSGGSWGAGSSGTSVYLACEAIREQIAKQLGVEADALTFQDGHVIVLNRRIPLAEIAGEGLEATGTVKPGAQESDTMQASYGAHFAEVRVNAITGEVRVSRMLGAFAAGRILNEKTARSQILGGMTFGIGAALSEELVHDTRSGKVVNHDLGEYHVPVNADVPQIDVMLLDERDVHANPLHAKGIGELGIAGAGAAIANAVYNATGVRVRDFPITLDKLLHGLPPV